MQRLPLISSIIVIVLIVLAYGFFPKESPHGNDLAFNCDECHTTKGWKMDADASFDHNKTNFNLEGQHKQTECLACHKSLVFSKANSQCNLCHSDIHEQTVGSDCEKCHTSESWLVNNIIDIHQMSRFPLMGAHTILDCKDCHQSASALQFPPLGTNCFDCHSDTYAATTKPNHKAAGFSTDCETCHALNAYEWSSTGFIHNFFPLTGGHDIKNCARCHDVNNYSNISSNCYSCHADDYNNTTNPNHLTSNFPTDCEQCHTTNPGWKPATFDHDKFFPIYSGKHNNEWNACSDCHQNTSNYQVFTCIDCHEHNKTDMDKKHDKENDYVYESNACFKCHPDGRADDK